LTNFRKADSDSRFPSALVHTEAVRPYGESFINKIASSSEDTYKQQYNFNNIGHIRSANLLYPYNGTKGFFLYIG
jgi:hypothetical protein